MSIARRTLVGQSMRLIQSRIAPCRSKLRGAWRRRRKRWRPRSIASGAGAEMRHAMGIAVFAGMLGVTLFGLILTPVFYVAVRRFAVRREARQPSAPLSEQNA